MNSTTQVLETVIFRSLKFLRRLGIFGIQLTQARLAQSVEHQTFNLRVAGSSPSSGDGNFENPLMLKMTTMLPFWQNAIETMVLGSFNDKIMGFKWKLRF